MNEGIVLLLTVLGTAGAGLTVLWYRDLIWPEHFPPAKQQRRPGPRRPPAARARQVTPAETEPKPAATVSPAVSGIATPDNDAEMVALRAVAVLIQANMITETAALETLFCVKPGSSKRYKAIHAKLKQAQSELDRTSAA
jgi:hypothetical protein